MLSLLFYKETRHVPKIQPGPRKIRLYGKRPGFSLYLDVTKYSSLSVYLFGLSWEESDFSKSKHLCQLMLQVLS